MSPELIGLIGVLVLLALLVFGVWIGMAMAIVGIFGIVVIRGFSQAMTMSGGIPFQNIAFYPITVIPVFILMGMVIAQPRPRACSTTAGILLAGVRWS